MKSKKFQRVAHSLLVIIVFTTFTLCGGNISYAAEGEETIYYFLEDHLGNIDVILDEEGSVVERRDYLPYGNERVKVSEEGAPDTDYGFTGKEKDDETGLYYYGARYYDPIIGSFTSIDPWEGDLTDPQSLNKYSYARNNPVRYVDPDGRTFYDNIIWSLGMQYLDYKGYGISAELLNYSVNWNQTLPFQGPSEKKGLYFNANITGAMSQKMGDEIKGTSEYQNMIKTIHDSVSAGDLNGREAGAFAKTDNPDLYYSINQFDYSFSAEALEDGNYNVDISITDTYDFDWKRSESFGDVVANMAADSQLLDAIQTYEIKIDLQETIKTKKDEERSK